jgi:parallel beta-helix repeat protein
VLRRVTADHVGRLVERHLPRLGAHVKDEIVRLLTDPRYEVREYPEDPDGKGLELTGNNYYEKGITGEEVKAVLDKTLKPTLNNRVVRKAKELVCEVQTTASPGLVGDRLRKVVASLEAARKYALTDHQRGEIDHLIAYFKDGDVEQFRQASIAWVKDRADSHVDFQLGWVEFYGDYLQRMASWESYVQIVDPDVSRKAQALARNAQYFEDAMPYGRFRKHFPAGYSPPAIMVYYFQEISPIRTGGYNLPNFDDIRRDVGAKNVIRLPMPGEDKDPDIRAVRRQALEAFLPADKVQPVLEHWQDTWRNLVLMHEIIGHGSGTYDTRKYGEKDDPVSVLGSLGGALEEQRADLTALLFVDDPRLVDIGLCKDAKQAKLFRRLTYDGYLADFLRRTAGGRSFTEMHQRGHWLFINKLLAAGAIRWAAKDGHSAPTPENQVLVVVDYDLYQKVARDLLEELQAIKANREADNLRQLFEKSAPLDAIHEPWAQAIIRRGQDLLINAGYVEQPWRVTADGKYERFGGRTLESIAPYWKQLGQGARGESANPAGARRGAAVPAEPGAVLRVGIDAGDIRGGDQRALQAAVDHVAALGGGTVYIGPGRYLMRNALTLRDNVRIAGEPARTILVACDGLRTRLAADGDCNERQITLEDPSGFRVGDGVAIQDGHYQSGFEVTTATLTARVDDRTFRISTPLYLDYMVGNKATARLVFPVVGGWNVKHAVVEGLTVEGNRARSEHVDGCRAGGIYLFECRGVTIRGCTVRDYNGDGISFQVSSGVTVEDCVCEHNAGLGIHPGSGSERPLVRRNRALDNGGDGLFVCWRVKHGLFEDNLIRGNSGAGLSIGHKDTDNLFRHNVITGNGQAGVLFREESEPMGAHRNVFEGNRILDNGRRAGAACVVIRGRHDDLVFRDNTIGWTQPSGGGVGIASGGQAKGLLAADNHFLNVGKAVARDSR